MHSEVGAGVATGTAGNSVVLQQKNGFKTEFSTSKVTLPALATVVEQDGARASVRAFVS